MHGVLGVARNDAPTADRMFNGINFTHLRSPGEVFDFSPVVLGIAWSWESLVGYCNRSDGCSPIISLSADAYGVGCGVVCAGGICT